MMKFVVRLDNDARQGAVGVASNVAGKWLTSREIHGLTVLLLVTGFFSAAPAQANTIVAASCNTAHVQAAINAAADGDVVVVPNGACGWSSGVTISGKGIHLKGSGNTEITNNYSGTENALILVSEDTTHRVRISDFKFYGGSVNTSNGARVIRLTATSGGKAVLIHNNTLSGDISFIRTFSNRGVIWGNTMTSGGHLTSNGGGVSFVQCTPYASDILAPSWTTAHTMGTRDVTGESNIYVEDNTIIRAVQQAMDWDGNCRMVARYNTFNNTALSSHGPDTGPVGLRHFEIYNNTWSFTNFGDCDGSRTAQLDYLFFLRGGTGVVTDNVIPSVSSCAWGTKNPLKFTVMMPWRNAGPYACWTGGYPVPRQIGQGHNGITTITDPVYIWNNTGGGSQTPGLSQEPNACGSSGSAQVLNSYLQLGRDYVIGARPGYAKYPYPHPLRGETARAPETQPAVPVNVRLKG